MRQALQLLGTQLLVAELRREAAQDVGLGAVAAVPLQHPSCCEGRSASVAHAAVTTACLAVHLALQCPGPSWHAQVLLAALAVRELAGLLAGGAAGRPRLGGFGDDAPGGRFKATRGLPRWVAPSVDVLRLEVLRRKRAPSVNAVDDGGRQGEEEGPAQLVVGLLEPHRHHLAAAGALHHRDVAAHVRLYQGVLDAQVADAEHQVVRTVDSADDRLVTEHDRAGAGLRPR
mmetsp:Transcript_20950/g.59234  ORF Transcript_20950/g.59234 Transcript_20950/m.59234 type:complete len:230 (-) Transcript_20950:533-1222(-)